jgi:phasin family protein
MRKPLSGTAASPRVRVACHRVRGRSQTARRGLIFIGTVLVQSELALEVATRAGTIIAQFTWTTSEKMAKRRQQTRRGVQARQTRPARHVAKGGADLFESSSGAVEQLWRSGLEMVSHVANRSSSQVARSMGLTDEKAHQTTEQSSSNIDVIVQSSKAYADALQSFSREFTRFCRERLDHNIERIDALMRSRTPQEFIAAQSDLFRDNFEGLLQSSRRVAQASVDVTDETTRRVTRAMSKQRRAA